MMRVPAVFIAVLCLAAAAALVALISAARPRATVRKRMHGVLVAGGSATAHGAASGPAPLPAFLARRLARAGWEPARGRLVLMAIPLLALILVAGALAGPWGAMSATLLLFLTGVAILNCRGAANRSLLTDSMLGFLERMSQLLAVGHSLPVALQRAAENSPPAVARCLASTIRRIANGAGAAESLERCAADFDLYELHLLAAAARANLRFGGALTAILKNAAANIRGRSAIERELRAGTTQIRASAWVLALLPLLVASGVMLTNPAYARWFLATSTGHKMIAYALLSQLLGALCMRAIVRTRF